MNDLRMRTYPNVRTGAGFLDRLVAGRRGPGYFDGLGEAEARMLVAYLGWPDRLPSERLSAPPSRRAPQRVKAARAASRWRRASRKRG